ncbi:MAG: GTPase, partial [Thermoplasmata archaeon]|nr:GTPase [Thermoplasmata archaeon]
NQIELQAIAALEHLADVMLYVFDPSESCGYTLKTQKNLLEELKLRFTEIPFIIVSNKSDLKSSNLGLQVSAKENIGITALLEEIKSTIESIS